MRIVLLHSYLLSALQLSAYEDTGGVLSVFAPWLVVVFDCYSHLRQRLYKCFGGVEIKLVKFCVVILSHEGLGFRFAASLSTGRISDYYNYQNNHSPRVMSVLRQTFTGFMN